MPERRFLNIKVRNVKKKSCVVLKWCESGKQEWITHALNDPEPAVEEFYAALAAFKPLVLKWVASTQSKKPGEGEVRILGVATKYTDDGKYKVVLSATTPIPGFAGPLVLNFPSIVPTPEMDSLLVALEEQAGAYIDGVRGQLEMDLPDEGTDEDADDELEV
jgi:hypothetical protein